MSTQSRLQEDELPPGLKDTGRPYAKFDIYDPAKVESGELDSRLTQLTSDQARSVLAQTVDMLKVFYLHDLSHRDLHMHNLMVCRDRDDPNPATLTAIDFGNSQIGNIQTGAGPSLDRKFDDLRDMFLRTASGIGDSVAGSKP